MTFRDLLKFLGLATKGLNGHGFDDLLHGHILMNTRQDIMMDTKQDGVMFKQERTRTPANFFI
jgi:hypothetical protein